MAWLVAGKQIRCALIFALLAGNLPTFAVAEESAAEEIYILRSVRQERQMPPTDFCATAKTKLPDPGWEDNYTFRSVATRADDGRVTDANAKDAGTMHACFGRTPDANVWDFYGEFVVHGLAGQAAGKCNLTKSDFPEKGIRLFGCNFELTGLPEDYAGGALTTNSLTSTKLFGTETEPAGYTQVSIATIRLWKKR